MLTFIFIVACLIVLAGLGTAFLASEGTFKFGGAVVAIVGILIVLSTCFSTVDARSLGIQTSMGKYRDTLTPGFHLTAPWSAVEEWTTRNQTIRFEGDGNGEERDNFFTEPRIRVKLGTQAEAFVDATVTWRITEKSVGDLWKQHKTFTDARSDFAIPAAKGAVNTAFDGYDPFKVTAPPSDPATATPVAGGGDKADGYIPLAEWSKRVTEALRPLYAARNVELVSVQVTYFDYGKDTKDKLSQLAAERQNTQIAAQKVLTAEKDAEASAKRATKVAPGCEALVRDLAAQDQLKNLPAGVQICSGASSGGVGVNVNAR